MESNLAIDYLYNLIHQIEEGYLKIDSLIVKGDVKSIVEDGVVVDYRWNRKREIMIVVEYR